MDPGSSIAHANVKRRVNVNASQVSARDARQVKPSVKKYHTRGMNLVLKNSGMTVVFLIIANVSIMSTKL